MKTLDNMFYIKFMQLEIGLLIVAIRWSFGKINLFVLKCFYSLKHNRDITPFLKTSRVMFFFKVLITNGGQCGYFNAISENRLRYSLFVKRIIAIEAQLYFFGLGQTIKKCEIVKRI